MSTVILPSAPNTDTGGKIGEILLNAGLVTKEQLRAAIHEQSVTRERIGRILVRNGFVRQRDLFRLLHEHNPGALNEESVFLSMVPASVLLETRSMVTAHVGSQVYIATLSSPKLVRRILSDYIPDDQLVFSAANPVRLEEYLSQLRATSVKTTLTWERIIHDSLDKGASDIHIVPRHSSYTVMIRRFGVLDIEHEGSLDEYIALVSRLKDLARMDMAERRRPQDGGFSMEHHGRVITFRVVSVPTVTGERIVIRILDPDSVNLSLDQLGISRISEWRKAVSLPDGLCLICGPTGSGKTTTLSSTVREMNFMERAIYSAEDPVEYPIPYAGQVNMNRTIDLDFSSAVRTFMRADPDVIIVGEIRDVETARNAIKAAETGHLVIGTLHTGSILGAIGRLRDIGIAPYELRHLLRGVMVQRLMRVFCPRCQGAGCSSCSDSGYKGREVVSEVAYFRDDAEVDAVIDGKVSWPSIVEDAVSKFRAGRTDMKELDRVFGAQAADVLASMQAKEAQETV